MKPQSAPQVPGSTEFERFDNAMRKFLTVSKVELLKAEKKWKEDHDKPKPVRKPKVT